ncbi:ABC transporter permease [Actinoplanes sp. N902-109]|uniref:ABC transporter permease n=1 Tax=Actinoplanes sp. (strain N902-109) TaxID=649831 RepID=UPI000329509F|nr:ABC transporter permease [Actinoplanes sp. N902-109]AGL17717.1 ABC-2 type transporter [Actinoplanes sp. N902-109]
MSALGTLTRTEATLFARNPQNLFMGLLFPAVLLLVQGLIIPGTDNPVDAGGAEFAGLRVIDLFVPIALTVAMATVSLTNFPSAIGGYRENGVLRRLGATPAGAGRILLAQLAVSATTLTAGATIAVAAAIMVLGATTPGNVPLVCGAFALGATSLLSLGAVVAARAGSAQKANATGTLLLFASLFTAGVWTPGPLMPGVLRTISAYTPLGAASKVLTAAWYSQPTPWIQVVVMAAGTAGFSWIAVRTFRWK